MLLHGFFVILNFWCKNSQRHCRLFNLAIVNDTGCQRQQTAFTTAAFGCFAGAWAPRIIVAVVYNTGYQIVPGVNK
jgi:hypothetical protein